MLHRLKLKLLYSHTGIVLCGCSLYLILTLITLITVKAFPAPELILCIFTTITAVNLIFHGICTITLIRHEGLRISRLFGLTMATLWVVSNVLAKLLYLYSKLRFIAYAAVLLCCYEDFFLAGMLIMAYAAARHKPAFDKDFVIIPGCSISKKGGLLPLLKGRTNKAIRFAWDQERATGKTVRFIPTGGQGPDEIISEGSAMEFYLLSHGAEQYEILPEKKSKNTLENMVFSAKIILADTPDARVCFATTSYHVLRTGMLARTAGLDAEGLASSTRWYFWPNALSRELIAIVNMHRLWQVAAITTCLAAAAILSAWH